MEKLLDWKLKFTQHNGAPASCSGKGTLLRVEQDVMKMADKKVKQLTKKAIRAGALSGISAGRIDEFIMVFAKAKSDSNTKHCCLGKGGAGVTFELAGCFIVTTEIHSINEAKLARIPETFTEAELNLTTEIRKVTHGTLRSAFDGAISGSTGCKLIKRQTNGILQGAILGGYLWLGGGILKIDGKFGGDLKDIQAAEIDHHGEGKAKWSQNPGEKMVHLNNARVAFDNIIETNKQITTKFEDLAEKIKKRLGSQENNEKATTSAQTYIDRTAKRAAEPHAVNAELTRHQKQSGIPNLIPQENETNAANEALKNASRVRGTSNRNNTINLAYLLVTVL
ncbi:unnamed protein product [Trypanosoma congolense IL3000]|uniref:WGS project CAEQ00000000 data, annotated contig 1287 n=1 Tax=Trypanosoma congolense (strain IL3000) TaxID=1068625 RepID=F9W580_TRYCI|nr:unnamed protein product [Trypanosoma congolense IL3000]